MYSVILVEDEYDIRKAIIDIIDWRGHGFEIVGDAGNGQEALELTEQLHPDLVITDIKMPFMDGIELVRRIREDNPIVRTVFLTGMSDFEYAKSAIQYNVMDYILKPVTAKKLEQSLTSIREKLEQEAERLKNAKQLEELYQQSLPEMRVGFLISLLTTRQCETSIQKRLHQLGLEFSGERYQIIVFRLHLPHQGQGDAEKIELLRPSMSRYVQQCCEKSFQSQCFLYGEDIICLASGERDVLREQVDLVFSEVCQYALKVAGYTGSVGIGREFSSLPQAKDGYESAITALRYRPATGKTSIIHIDDMEKEDAIQFLFSTDDEEKLKTLLKTSDESEMEQFLEGCFRRCDEKGASVSDYHLMLMEMFIVLARTAKSVLPNFEINVGNNLDFMTQLYRTETIGEAKDWIKRLGLNIMKLIARQRTDSAQDLGEQAVNLIRTQFADPELTMKRAAAQLHISPTYFGSIVKKHTGTSFTNLLIETRMNQAKDLILNTNQKIFEIAEQTGYQNQHYFSYCFKMFHGVSPNEMRSSSRKEQDAQNKEIVE